MSVLRALIKIAVIIVTQFTINDYLDGYNQTEYCNQHYANGAILCHKMPMNMTMTVSDKMPMNMIMPVSHEK